MVRPTRWQPAGIALAFFLILNALFFYGFVRDGLWAVLAVLLVPLYRRIGFFNFLTLAVSFSLVTLALVGAAGWFRLADGLYPDPSSRLSTIDAGGLPIYRKNAEITMRQPFGDLRRVADPDLMFDLEPRDVRFRVDGFGFRNDADYHGQRFVLVGDSFVVGNGNSQENNLTAQLRRDFGVDTYNLGFPTDIKGYAQNIEKFEDRYGSGFRVLLFLYEGNDFTEKEDVLETEGFYRIKANVRRLVRAYKRWFWDTHLYRATWALYQSWKSDLKRENRVSVLKVGPRRVAINNGYTAVARRRAYTPPAHLQTALAQVRGRIEHVFFIPVKYRVLQSVLDNTGKLPDEQWRAVRAMAKQLGLPATDLTEPLRQATRKTFARDGQLTFWTDDTHWNALGIAAAARAVCETVAALKCKAPPPENSAAQEPNQPVTVSHN